jgi:hypothetical protein
MKIQNDFFFFERLCRMQENKTFFFVFFLCNLFFGTFKRKSGILIPDLYLYSIDIQTNIKLKFDKKIRGKVIDFSKGFLEFFWKLFLN